MFAFLVVTVAFLFNLKLKPVQTRWKDVWPTNTYNQSQIAVTYGQPRCEFTYSCAGNEECTDGHCKAAAMSKRPHFPGRGCLFDHDCPNRFTCGQDFTCYASGNTARNHFEGVKCVHDGHCPWGWQCRAMTCWDREARNHLQGRLCTYDFECPASFSCISNICYDGALVQHLEGRICRFHYQCPSGYGCSNYTCYIDQSEHQEGMCLVDSQCPANQRCRLFTCFSKAGNIQWHQSVNSRWNNRFFGGLTDKREFDYYEVDTDDINI